MNKARSIARKFGWVVKMCAGLMLGLVSFAASAAAGPSPAAQAEIKHLLTAIERSGCEFLRDGQSYGAARARAHLQRKYDYLLRKGLASTSEEFIERAGSGSSTSGKPYQIRCGKGEAVPSGQWLSTELRAYREKQSPKASLLKQRGEQVFAVV